MTEGKAGKTSQAKKAQSKQAKSQTIAEIMANKKAVTKKVPIQTDGEIAGQIAEMRALFTAARDNDRLTNEPDKAPDIQEQIDALVEESQTTVVMFTFESIGRPNYDALVEEHQPSKEEQKKGAEFDAETFPPALISASCSDPEIPLEDAIAMFESPKWNNAELRLLFFGALEVNTETGDIPLSRSDSEGTLNSLLSLVTQSNGESPTLSM